MEINKLFNDLRIPLEKHQIITEDGYILEVNMLNFLPIIDDERLGTFPSS